jgi:hypothetical protein
VLRLYINGDYINTATIGTGINSSANNLFRIGSLPTVANGQYFRGQIDEVRVFNVALTDDQVQKMVYQEMHNTNFARGAFIPLDIPGLATSSLIRYFRMDTYKNDILDNLVTPTVDTGTGAKLYNIKNIYWQTAPLPYTTIQDGAWTTASSWQHNAVWDMPSRPWSIVWVRNDITHNASFENAGLIIDTNKKLTANNNIGVTNNWYLKLDGKLDLNGMSQLIQTQNSELDVTSSGSIDREQTGVANLFNYNYWSLPVSTTNNTTNNHGASITNVFRDATSSSSFLTPSWTTAFNGNNTSPLTLSTRWLYRFQNVTGIYANWSQITQTTTLGPGHGFTMKGTQSLFAGQTQNYAFVGKPNNGTITIPIAANNSNLSGNPYPSAIDANQFILDNIDSGNAGSSNAINGTLYFWQHANENNSHVLAQYRGGYATRNLVGGVAPASASPLIFGLGSAARIS